MFYHFLYPLKDLFFGFNVFRYITFRSAGAAITAFLISVIFGNFFIRKLYELKIGQRVRKEECPALYQLHRDKEGTPTMGGILIIFSVFVSLLLWGNLTNKFILLTFFVCIWLGTLGFIDDYIKLTKKSSKGLSISAKLFWQLVLGLILGIVLYLDPSFTTGLSLPFFKNVVVNLGIFYIFFVAVVIIGSSNAVNLTDGLDGLAIGCVSMVALTYGVLSYISGHAKISQYLFTPFIPGAGEMAVFCSCLVGAGLGFLWFNSYPANVFMGDVGSLFLGGSIGAAAVFIKKELLLVIVGGVFVAEAISVILQVASFRLRGKRIFKVAPLHHHYQMLGWVESKVIVRFWIISAILALISLAILKLR